MMEFEQRHFKNFQQQLKKTQSASDPNKTLIAFLGGMSEDSLCFAWRVYVGETVGQSEDLQFKEMQLVYVGIQPLVVVLFDTDSVHWGAARGAVPVESCRQALGALPQNPFPVTWQSIFTCLVLHCPAIIWALRRIFRIQGASESLFL